MDFERGQVVLSRAGHDKGRPFFIVETEDGFLLLADGKERKVAAPKRKRIKHVSEPRQFHHPVAEQLRSGKLVMDSEIRRALAVLRDELGGYDAWQRTT